MAEVIWGSVHVTGHLATGQPAQAFGKLSIYQSALRMRVLLELANTLCQFFELGQNLRLEFFVCHSYTHADQALHCDVTSIGPRSSRIPSLLKSR
jgi:hypothetical protein